MASRKPLVLVGGQMQQLQSADSINLGTHVPITTTVTAYPASYSTTAVVGIANMNDAAWSPTLGLWAAVIRSTGAGTQGIYTSPNGVVWTPRTTPATTGQNWIAILWSVEQARFLAISNVGNSSLRGMISTDGITWSQSRNSSSCSSIAYASGFNGGSGMWLIGGFDRILTSPDASDSSWSSAFIPGTTSIRGLAYSPTIGATGRAVSSNFSVTNNWYYTDDGVAFTTVSGPVGEWAGKCWAPALGIFCAVSRDITNPQVATSTDGIAWTTHAATEANVWEDIDWSPELGLFVAVASTGTNRVMTSPDGTNWTAHAASEADVWVGVSYSSTLQKFAAFANSGTNNVMLIIYSGAVTKEALPELDSTNLTNFKDNFLLMGG